jgi:predicted cation transporter
MKIEFDIVNREFFRTLTFSLKFQKKAQVSIIYMKNIEFPITSVVQIAGCRVYCYTKRITSDIAKVLDTSTGKSV